MTEVRKNVSITLDNVWQRFEYQKIKNNYTHAFDLTRRHAPTWQQNVISAISIANKTVEVRSKRRVLFMSLHFRQDVSKLKQKGSDAEWVHSSIVISCVWRCPNLEGLTKTWGLYDLRLCNKISVIGGGTHFERQIKKLKQFRWKCVKMTTIVMSYMDSPLSGCFLSVGNTNCQVKANSVQKTHPTVL